MKNHYFKCSSMLLILTSAISAQQWEAGALGGYSISRENGIKAGSTSGSVKFESAPVYGFFAGSNDYRFLGGEASYLYRGGNLNLSGPGRSISFDSHTQFIDFRLVVHFSPRESRLRPFLAVGGGVALYSGTGVESAAQPLGTLAALTHTRETKPMVSGAAGVKFRLTPHFGFRAEFRDYVTPFPNRLVAPPPGSSISGWVHNFVPVVGIVGVF
jgi:hypothetical protein